ncbi:MAG: hypothetical protein ACTHN2_21250 [Nitrobacter sp.]
MNSQQIGLRVQALETASRLGLPPKMTLEAAREYLAFLEGTEVKLPSTPEWMIASLSRAVQKKTPVKKAAPKRLAAKA